MPYLSCDQCKYQCRVAADLLGKKARCPKCGRIESIVADLPKPTQTATTSAKTGSAQAAELYIGNIMKRRGPVSLEQLQLLHRWNLIDKNELLSDESGSRRSTVQEFLATNDWPVEIPAPRRFRRMPRLDQLRRILPASKPEKPPEPQPSVQERNATHEEFMAIIDRAVQMERNARTVEFERTESPVEVYVQGPGARLVRTEQFARSYRLIAFVFIINALICCFFSTSTMGMFVKRLLQLSASVFIPFEQTGELIEGEPLLQCGMALALVCGQFVLPIFWLVRQDCVIWHCLGATFLGLLLGMAMKPEWLWFGFECIRGTAALTGLAISAITWNLSCYEHSGRVATRIRIAAIITAVSSAVLMAVNMESVFVAEMTGLSPSISGNGFHIAVFAICFFGVMVSIPFSVVSILYQEASQVVRTFMIQKVITVLVLGTVGGISAMCIAYPQTVDFLNVPMAVLPIACANILAVITPPVLWLLDPDFSLSRN
jgi:hypothetical protein